MDAGTQSPLPIAASSESTLTPPPPSENPPEYIDAGNAGNDIELPLEYQVHEVDMNNPDMDPFEYAFRKYVPIPRAYFWDTASEANDNHRNLPFGIKSWHRSIYYLSELLRKAEAGGEMIANVLGVNDGPFNYVTSRMTEDEMTRSRMIVEERMEEVVEMKRRKEEGVV
jgi:hypothetical protein